MDAARIIGANTWTYLLWENDEAQPSARFIPHIITWLGYNPFPEGETLGEKITARRQKHGLTRKQLAKLLSLNVSSV